MIAMGRHLQVGDWMPMAKKINGTTAFKATAFETSRWLPWQNRTLHGPEGLSICSGEGSG